jgi:hypothetical protein
MRLALVLALAMLSGFRQPENINTWWLYKTYGQDPTTLPIYKAALPDTLVWRRNLAYNEPYVEMYFRHPAYNNYPVVGVSWKQAMAFCNWRSKYRRDYLRTEQMMQEQDPQAYQNKLVAANELAKTASGGQSNAATGVLGGAAAGAAFGPYGAAVGAGVGLVGSLAQMRAAKKQREREATAGMYNREAQQIQRTNEQNISVMSNMLSALRTAFTV